MATENESMFELSTYSTQQIEPLLPLLQEWGEREFIHYPYLWVPAKEEIFEAYALLAREKNSLVAVVRNQGKIIGLAAGVPLDAGELQALFDEVQGQGFDPSQIFYMSLFLTAPEYRNDERLVELIFDKYVDFIRSIGRTQICYFDDPGRPDHPLKPENPLPIEPWGHVIGGFRRMNVNKQFVWPTLQLDGSVKEEIHQLEFFVKDI
jgi:hypothetical protein